MKVIYLPIEPYPNRYTEDWITEFEDAFNCHPYFEECHVVLGERLTNEITTGQVLDAEGTNYWKSSQLMNLIKLFQFGYIQDGDKIFVADLWFPGLEMIPYICKMKMINVEVYGVFHAGTYDSYDFTCKYGMGYFGEYSERSWLSIATKIFVGSEYHKELICQTRRLGFGELEKKVVVTGLPINLDGLKGIRQKADYYKAIRTGACHKKNRILFSHRIDPEKNLEGFLKVCLQLATKRTEELEFVICSPRKVEQRIIDTIIGLNDLIQKYGSRIILIESPSREEYFKTVLSCNIIFSSAYQETFGYAVLEGVALGLTPIIPNRLSYATMYPRTFRYDNLKEAFKLCEDVLDGKIGFTDELKEIPEKYSRSIDRIMEEMCK